MKRGEREREKMRQNEKEIIERETESGPIKLIRQKHCGRKITGDPTKSYLTHNISNEVVASMIVA